MTVLCLQCNREFDSPVRSRTDEAGTTEQIPTQDLCHECRWNKGDQDDTGMLAREMFDGIEEDLDMLEDVSDDDE